MYRSSGWTDQYSGIRRSQFENKVKIKVVDIERFTFKSYGPSKSNVILGWLGSVGTPLLGANKENITNGEVGLWASDTLEWIEELSVLIDKPELRKKIRKKGREGIEKKYSLQAMAPKLVNRLNQL